MVEAAIGLELATTPYNRKRMANLFSEFKRRNVYKVAALYVIVGWVVLQVIDLFMSFMPLPEWTSRLVFVLLAAGFPVALLLAWAFDLTPEGIKLETSKEGVTKTRRGDLLIYSASAVVLVFWVSSLDWWQGAADTEATEIRSLVVLPLDNLMNDPEQAYFVEGMHEALITELSKIDALRVISRTSAMKYLDSKMTVPEIGQELGVDAIIEGSVLRAGNTVRITTQLIKADSDEHLWAGTFDRELKDIFALYADVTREIVDRIRVEVTPGEAARFVAQPAVNAEAYELYLKGRYLCDQWGPQKMLQGLELMRQAVAKGPDNPQAQSGLGFCLQYAAFFSYVVPLEIADEAERAAKKALELDHELADGWVSFAGVRYYLNFDMTASELALERALSLNPNNARALVHYSWQLGEAGRFDEAVEAAEKAISLDPFSPTVRTTKSQALYLHRDFDQTIAEYDEIIEMDRNDPSFHLFLAWALEQTGELEQAISHHERAIELSFRSSLYVAGLGHALGLAERREDAERILAELIGRESEARAEPFHIAMVHIGLGNYDLAVDWLEKAFAARNSHMLYIKQGAQFDPLRNDPRFKSLLEQMGW